MTTMASEIQTTTAEIPDTAQYGWHFSEGPTGTLHDGSPVPDVGMVHSVEDRIEIRRNAMHMCPRAFDALRYAPGPYLEWVGVWGDVEGDGDKIGGRHRVVLWREDAEDVLRDYAQRVALDAMEEHCPRERAEDEGVAEEWETVMGWLRGEHADRVAAWYAARDAAKAARYAARDAAKAAWTAAGAVATVAAWYAARAAAGAAGRAAARAVRDAARDTRFAAKAASAARYAAWAAARERYADLFDEMVVPDLERDDDE